MGRDCDRPVRLPHRIPPGCVTKDASRCLVCEMALRLRQALVQMLTTHKAFAASLQLDYREPPRGVLSALGSAWHGDNCFGAPYLMKQDLGTWAPTALDRRGQKVPVRLRSQVRIAHPLGGAPLPAPA